MRDLADMVVANSQAGLRWHHVPPDRGRVVYNAFDPARLEALVGHPSGGNARGDDRRPFTVVMAARMHLHKDYRSLIAAARLLASRAGRRPGVSSSSGTARCGEELEVAAADLVAAGVVQFASPGLEVLPLLERADVGRPDDQRRGARRGLLELDHGVHGQRTAGCLLRQREATRSS